MNEEQFIQLVEKSIGDAIKDVVADQMRPILEKVRKEQQSDRDTFMKACIAAGGNEVSCESQWNSQVKMLSEGMKEALQHIKGLDVSIKISPDIKGHVLKDFRRTYQP